MKKTASILGAVTFAGALMAAGTVFATPTIYLDDGAGDTLLYTQGGSAVTTGSVTVTSCTDLTNGVTCIASLGVWNVNVSTGLTQSPNPELDLNSIDQSTAAGSITIIFTDNGFNAGASGSANFITGIGGTTEGTVLWQAGDDTANNACGAPTLPSCTQVTPVYGPAGPGAFSGTNSFTFTGISGPVGLALGVNITHTAAGGTSFDYNGKVPEPATLALLGIGLLGAAVVGRRKSS